MDFINEELENAPATITNVSLADGKNESVTVIITVEVEGFGSIKSYQYLNNTIRRSGRHQGRTNCECTVELLRDLGWASAPDCSHIDEILNNPCSITTEIEEGKCRVKWLNAPHSSLDPSEANRRIQLILGGESVAPPPRPKTAPSRFDTEDPGDIPF